MAMQTLDVEAIPKFKSSVEDIEELQKNLKTGFENTHDICVETGSQKLITSADSASEGVDTIVKVSQELGEVLNTLIKQYEKLQAAL